MLRSGGCVYTYLPSTGEHKYRGGSYSWTYSLATKSAYEKVLRQFLRDFAIEELTDNEGRAVELPIGLTGFNAGEAP